MPDNLTSKNVVLFGAGPMAKEHAKVLKHLGANFTVVGRSREGIEWFQEHTGIAAISNGVPGWLEKKGRRGRVWNCCRQFRSPGSHCH